MSAVASHALPRRAFTLIEVLLAIVIVTALFSVVLFFYQQAARLRTELLVEAERISSARLLMSRITTELRCARRHSYYPVALLGDGSSIQFITTVLPSHAAWNGAAYGRVSRPETDLKLVSYRVASDAEGTNSIGLQRAEEPLITFRKVEISEFSSGPAQNTNRYAPTLLTDQLHALRFRYFDGAAWADSWGDTRLPKAVEITVAANPLPGPEEETETVDENVFRRVVYLPGSAAPAPRGSSSSTNAAMEASEVLP